MFRRALFAWSIADGDMHLKNLALLKSAEPGLSRFATVRFAPLHDAVTTRVFPGFADGRMALKLNGKDDLLMRHDFLTLARTIDLPATRAGTAISEMATRLHHIAPRMALPERVGRGAARAAEGVMCGIVAERIAAFL